MFTDKQTNRRKRSFTCLAWNARESVIYVAVCNNLGLLCGPRNLQNIITPIMREMDRSSENLQKECDQDTLHWSMRPAQCSDLQSTRKLGSPAMYSQHINFKKLARSAMRRRCIKCKKKQQGLPAQLFAIVAKLRKRTVNWYVTCQDKNAGQENLTMNGT